MTFDEELIERLLTCEKEVIQAPGKPKLVRGHYRIHKITTTAIESGLKEDCLVEITDKYATFEDALRFFVKYIHLKSADIKRHFPGKNLQTSFLDIEGE